jgi:isoquinoline 1-oxidoreductase beta subunit
MVASAPRSRNVVNVASVVEVEVDATGRVKIPRVDQVVDAGTIVNPDRVRSQFEGAAVIMNTAPYQTHVHLVESDAPPTGAGEPGVPPVLAALANAVFAATGKRVRELPLSRQKLA